MKKIVNAVCDICNTFFATAKFKVGNRKNPNMKHVFDNTRAILKQARIEALKCMDEDTIDKTEKED